MTIEKRTGWVYKMVSPTGRIYIGSTSNLVSRKSHYKTYSHKMNTKICRSITKYGFDSHNFTVIEEVELSLLRQREAYWGSYYNTLSPENLNLALPKSNEVYTGMSDEAKLALSIAQKKRNATGERSHMWGKKQSVESLKKRSEAMAGEKNHNSKIVLDLSTGIYYVSAVEASEALGINVNTLRGILTGRINRNINLKYV